MFVLDNISTPISFNADVSDDIAIAEGDEAADRIISGATLIDHLKIGRALLAGSRIAAREAGVAQGKPYNVAYNKWLQARPKLAAVNEQNRAAALWCLNELNWPRVEKYLATLGVEERQTITLRTVRRRLDTPSPRPAAPSPTAATQAAYNMPDDDEELGKKYDELADERDEVIEHYNHLVRTFNRLVTAIAVTGLYPVESEDGFELVIADLNKANAWVEGAKAKWSSERIRRAAAMFVNLPLEAPWEEIMPHFRGETPHQGN